MKSGLSLLHNHTSNGVFVPCIDSAQGENHGLRDLGGPDLHLGGVVDAGFDEGGNHALDGGLGFEALGGGYD